jgi:hypothetical protein
MNDSHRQKRFIRQLIHHLHSAATSSGLVDESVALNRLAYARGAIEALRLAGLVAEGSDLNDELTSALDQATWIRLRRSAHQPNSVDPRDHDWLNSRFRDVDTTRVLTIVSGATGQNSTRDITARILTIELFAAMTIVRWMVTSSNGTALVSPEGAAPIPPPFLNAPEDVAELIATTWKQRVENAEILRLLMMTDDGRTNSKLAFDFVQLSETIGIGMHIFGPILPGARRMFLEVADFQIREEHPL